MSANAPTTNRTELRTNFLQCPPPADTHLLVLASPHEEQTPRGILRHLLACFRRLWQRSSRCEIVHHGRRHTHQLRHRLSRSCVRLRPDRAHDGIRYRSHLGLPSQSRRLGRSASRRTLQGRFAPSAGESAALWHPAAASATRSWRRRSLRCSICDGFSPNTPVVLHGEAPNRSESAPRRQVFMSLARRPPPSANSESGPSNGREGLPLQHKPNETNQ
jgi:hypothetical protein